MRALFAVAAVASLVIGVTTALAVWLLRVHPEFGLLIGFGHGAAVLLSQVAVIAFAFRSGRSDREDA